jgi:hypothetical protein
MRTSRDLHLAMSCIALSLGLQNCSTPAASTDDLEVTATDTLSASPAVIHPSQAGGLCLDVAWGNTANGTAVQIANCNGGSAQAWAFSGGMLRVFGNKCLDVTDGVNANGTRLQIWDCTPGNRNQQWTAQGSTLVWSGTDKCVDVPGDNVVDGAHLQVYACNGTGAQSWAQTAGSGGSGGGTTGTPTATSLPPSPAPPPGGRELTVVNQCGQPVWVALQPNGGKPVPSPSGFELTPGAAANGPLPQGWGGRLWGRTGCAGGGNAAVCQSGDCGGVLSCNGAGGQPSSLVEWTFDGAGNQDFYDISLVDAFNLPVGVAPRGGTGTCHAPMCRANVLAICPADLQVKNSAGQVVDCLSSCTRYQTDATCCRGANNTPATCPPPPGAQVFKQACPEAYSYAYDDGTSTFTCSRPTGYTVTFCP